MTGNSFELLSTWDLCESVLGQPLCGNWGTTWEQLRATSLLADPYQPIHNKYNAKHRYKSIQKPPYQIQCETHILIHTNPFITNKIWDTVTNPFKSIHNKYDDKIGANPYKPINYKYNEWHIFKSAPTPKSKYNKKHKCKSVPTRMKQMQWETHIYKFIRSTDIFTVLKLKWNNWLRIKYILLSPSALPQDHWHWQEVFSNQNLLFPMPIRSQRWNVH